jgi:sugar/nucleoside kinase (ribokinase family)
VDQGRRLGGGAANTGIGLVWAGHEVIIASRIGLDETGDWLLGTVKSRIFFTRQKLQQELKDFV